MSDWSGNDYLNALARRPAASAPATLGQVWDAEWQRAGLDTITGVGKPLDDAQSELEGAVTSAAGGDLNSYARAQGVDLSDAMSFDQRVKAVQALAGTLPDEAKKKIEPLFDVRKNAALKAQKIEADANDVAAATYGLSGTATAWLAGLTRQSTDLVNLGVMAATAPVGGPLEGAITKVLLRQAGAAGLAQAATEPVVESARGDLGLESGFKRAAENVGGAAIGGAGLAGLFRGGAYLLGRLRGRGIEAPQPAKGASAETEPYEPAPVSEYQTFAGLDRGGPIEHPAALGAGAAGAPDFVGSNLDIAAGAEARVQKGKVAPEPFEPGNPAPLSEYQTFGGLDRGRAIEHPAALGAGAGGAPGFVGSNLDIAAGANARVQKGRAPFYEPGPSDYRPTDFTHEDMASLDRGQPRPTTYGDPAVAAGAADLSGFGHNLDFADGVRAMREFAPGDLEAAAKIEERNHVLDAAAAEAHAGEIDLLHGYRAEQGFNGFLSADQVADAVRYDGGGGVFGRYTYLDPTGKWVTGRNGALGINAAVRVRAKFKKLFTLTPNNVTDLEKLVGGEAIGNGKAIAEKLRAAGYDGIHVKGFDDLSPEKFPGRLDPDVMQDQVVAFHPDKSLRVERDLNLPKVPEDGFASHADTEAYFAARDKIVESEVRRFRQNRPVDVVEHNEKINAAADALEAGPEAAPPPAPIGKKRFGRQVQDPATFSALEYLAFRGGIRQDDPLINDLLQSFGGENPFVPGFGKLVRKPVSDRSPASAARAPAFIDEAITRLKEGGYLFDPADQAGGVSQLSHTDVLGLIDAEARGNKQYRLDYEPKATRDPLREKEHREEQRAQITAQIDGKIGETAFPATAAIRERAVQIMEREGEKSPLDALERALQERDDRKEALRREREQERIEIPGWDVPASTDVGRAPEAGRPLQGEPSERPGGAGERGDARGPGDSLREGERAAVGDPQLSADANRAIEQAPEIVIELPDGRRMTARDALAEAEEEARAAAEFKNCAGGGAVDGGSDDIPF